MAGRAAAVFAPPALIFAMQNADKNKKMPYLEKR